MGLQTYIKKRNFKKTPEPKKKKNNKTAKGTLKFVVQRHQASHLHYDFRLEMEGVLKSWAIPKGPSMNPNDKRLAVMVEDHPYDYRTFSGIIPKGNYGAGVVEIWDEGIYHSAKDSNKNTEEKTLLKELEEGNLKLILQGKKLKGEFALVKIKRDEKNTWLLLKKKDNYSTLVTYSSENFPPLKKVNEADFKEKPTEQGDSKSISKSPMPHNIQPMLTRLIDKPFDNKDWIFELKLDGYRAIAEVQNKKVNLYSRSGLSFNEKYAPIAESLSMLDQDVVLDGEIVMIGKDNRSHFQLLQQYENFNKKNLYYYVFDLLYLNGYDLRNLPLLERKNILKELKSGFPRNIKYTDYTKANGINFFKKFEKEGYEGIIGKNIHSTYNEGKRTGEWVKIKTHMRQEAVIGGFTAPRGGRKHLGALVLGVYENGELVYIGHSGGGLTHKALQEVKEKLIPLIQKNSPFKSKVITNAPVTWVKPKLVCEIVFSEWTSDKHMRHPIFVGLREDKNPKEVILEKALHAENVVNDKASSETNSFNKEKKEVIIDRHKLTLTNLSKIYWPDEGYTKGDLIKYYSEIADYILPYLKDRPESLNRHPNGIKGKSFYHKDMGDAPPKWVKTSEIYSESNDKNINYLICQNKATLIYMNNLGCIEINPWNSRLRSLNNPDYLVIDLDPGENTFKEVTETALVVKAVLDRAKAECYCKTSGATGMHIYIPLGARYSYEQARDFAHVIAQLTHEQLPKLTSLERSLKARRKKIYLDYLQNSRGQTLAAVYSARPKLGATISTPLQWEELKSGLHPSEFTIKTIPKRLQKIGDLFQGVLGKGVDIIKSLDRLGKI